MKRSLMATGQVKLTSTHSTVVARNDLKRVSIGVDHVFKICVYIYYPMFFLWIINVLCITISGSTI
jgi:hypothetical protein